MRRFVFYHPETGVLHNRTVMMDVGDVNCLKLNTPVGYVAFEHDTALPATHRFDLASKQLVEEMAPAPSPNHEWSAWRRRWVRKQTLL